MADHPLRPATDRRLGRPLPCQLANRTRTPLQARALRPPLTSRCYAVLARVSPGYPPPSGRLSTRYSPVRRSTQVLLPGLARLACVKHAASVHSEPGSNSPVFSGVPCGTISSSMPSASLILALFVLLVLLSPGPRLFSSRPRLTSKKSLLYFPYSVFKESAGAERVMSLLRPSIDVKKKIVFFSTRSCPEGSRRADQPRPRIDSNAPNAPPLGDIPPRPPNP